MYQTCLKKLLNTFSRINNFFFPLLKPKGQKRHKTEKTLLSFPLSNIYLMFTTNE